jgi:hypothetical protein
VPQIFVRVVILLALSPLESYGFAIEETFRFLRGQTPDIDV